MEINSIVDCLAFLCLLLLEKMQLRLETPILYCFKFLKADITQKKHARYLYMHDTPVLPNFPKFEIYIILSLFDTLKSPYVL